VSDEEVDRESQPSQRSVASLLRENVCLFKGSSEAQLDHVVKCMSRRAAGLGSPGVWCHISEAVCLADKVTLLVVREIEGVEDCLV
jgi:hypothetical protein